ncbi:MAG: hypothetical protein HKN23_21095 [Verrucomicrobiales bacterium]|nr:hypothetical protein [Verrucomicrobiales bacterium]
MTRTDPVLVERAMDLQKEVYQLQKEKALLEEDAAKAQALAKQIAEMVTEYERAKLERDQIKGEFESLQTDYDELIAQLKPIDDLLTQYEKKLRDHLVGEKLGNVELRDGRVLSSVRVEEVATGWVKLKHSDGISNIEFQLLPEHLQRKFSFRPSMVTTDSLIAQTPVEENTEPPKEVSLEDAAKMMQEAMAAERERTKVRQQENYRKEIATLTEEIKLLESQISQLGKQRSAARAEVTKGRKIKISKADQEKATAHFDYKINQARREIVQRKARIEAVKTMLD